jgi:hypothetical protein
LTLLLYRSDADESPTVVTLGDNPDPEQVDRMEAAYRARGLDVVMVATEDESKFVETRK